MFTIKRVTKNNILRYIDMKKEYEKTQDALLLEKINKFTDEVINSDKHYYHKLYNYNLSEEQLKYCL